MECPDDRCCYRAGRSYDSTKDDDDDDDPRTPSAVPPRPQLRQAIQDGIEGNGILPEFRATSTARQVFHALQDSVFDRGFGVEEMALKDGIRRCEGQCVDTFGCRGQGRQ